MKTLHFPLLLLAFSITLTPQNVHARRPLGTTMTGVIQQVDHATRRLVFAQDGGPVRRFVYTAWAQFWHDAPDASPTALKPGMRVQVSLHNPLFGPDFVMQITLLQTVRR